VNELLEELRLNAAKYEDALYQFHSGAFVEATGESSIRMGTVPDMDTGDYDVVECIEWFGDGSDTFWRLTFDEVRPLPVKIERVKILGAWHRPKST